MKKFRKLTVALLNLIVLGIIALLCLFASNTKNSLSSQGIADRWSANGEIFAQVSTFITPSARITQDDIDTDYISEQLKQSGVEIDTWTYAYSSSYDGPLSVTFENNTVQVSATGVGGSFFTFHPLELVSGTYLDERYHDRVVIDDELAWQLFGASDVAGIEIEIDGTRYVIAGVVKMESDFVTSKAYGDNPRIYLPLDNSSAITCIDLLLPNPTSNFALGIAESAVEKMTANDTAIEIIDNTSRYSLTAIFCVISDFGTRSMSLKILDIPYWENAARAIEDYLALFLIIIVILLFLPLVTVIYCMIFGYRNWRIRFSLLKEKIENKIDLLKSRKVD